MLSFLVKSDQNIGKRNNSRISEETGQMLYTWKKQSIWKAMGQEQRNEVELKSVFLPPSLTPLPLSHQANKFLPSSALERQRLQAPSFFCASIIVIIWATTSVVKESYIFFSESACLSNLEGTYFRCLSLCIRMHGPLRLGCYLLFPPYRDRYSGGRKLNETVLKVPHITIWFAFWIIAARS